MRCDSCICPQTVLTSSSSFLLHAFIGCIFDFLRSNASWYGLAIARCQRNFSIYDHFYRNIGCFAVSYYRWVANAVLVRREQAPLKLESSLRIVKLCAHYVVYACGVVYYKREVFTATMILCEQLNRLNVKNQDHAPSLSISCWIELFFFGCFLIFINILYVSFEETK